MESGILANETKGYFEGDKRYWFKICSRIEAQSAIQNGNIFNAEKKVRGTRSTIP
jgi:hypothetical protein